MAVSYKRLWKLLVDKEMSKSDLRKKAEIWDLYDESRELVGREHVRGEQLPIDGYHLVVHVWIRKIIEGKIFNDIMDVWLFEYDGEVDLGNATTDEVAIQWKGSK